MEISSKNIASSVLSHHGEFAPIQIIKAAGDAPLLNIMEEYFNIYLDKKFKNPYHTFTGEIFKPVIGYEDFYEVSNYGRVISIKRERWNGYFFQIIPRRVICHSLGKGKLAYYSVQLWKSNERKKWYVHRLVALAFLKPPVDQTVNHKNGNKINNFYWNLEWMSFFQNNQHSIDTGLTWRYHGTDVHCSKLTDHKVMEIKELLSKGYSQRKLAAMFHVSRGPIQRIAEGTGWKHVYLS